jgi:hypothetical protein
MNMIRTIPTPSLAIPLLVLGGHYYFLHPFPMPAGDGFPTPVFTLPAARRRVS